MIGNEINCLKKGVPIQIRNATSYCQSLNASQILPKSKQESDDLVSALLSLGLDSIEDGSVLVSIDIYMSVKEKGWSDSTGQLISYFNWLPFEPKQQDINQNYAGLRIDKVGETAGWADYSRTDFLNVVCTKRGQSQGKYN